MIILAAFGGVSAGFAAAVAAVLGAMSLAMRADERRVDAALDFERHADQAIAVSADDLKLWEAELAS